MSSKVSIKNLCLSVPDIEHKKTSYSLGLKKNNSIPLLNDINIDLTEGDTLGLIGLNGSGKTTFFKCLAGIYENYDGEISINGTIAPILELGMGFKQELTGYENILLVARLMKQEINNDLVLDIIKFSGIGESIDQKIQYYSSGMLARLSFSIMSSINSDILLLDEVFAVGDALFVEKATNKMKDKINKSKIVIMSSHNIKQIESFCNKVLLLHKGQQIFYGELTKGVEIYKSKYSLG